MEVCASTSASNNTTNRKFSGMEIELHYLMAKYLSLGPCAKAAEVLKKEMEANKLLPKKYDWLGNGRDNSFAEMDIACSHLSSDHLLQLAARLGPAIDQLVALKGPSVGTLLGAGTHSLLRTEKDLWKNFRTTSSLAVRYRSNPLLDPIQVAGPPKLNHLLTCREFYGSAPRSHFSTDKIYERMQMFSRVVGHLSAVYCLLFDRTGRFIVTGADDMLVKIWSTTDGRLMATLRGASAEISDLAIDNENMLVAAGSCDKVIRVWSLQTLSPVAVLSSHTGMVTAVQFCPAPDNEGVLVSTGGDGCVAFWTYRIRGLDVKFDPKPYKRNERVRAGRSAQLICAAFSSGGNFLALGGADHFVRVYRVGGQEGIDRLIEEECSKDRVDSIQWCHQGLRFISGSRDGVALVWRYEAQRWQYMALSMNKYMPGEEPPIEDPQSQQPPQKVLLPQVTMVGWDLTDTHVITASSDKLVRVWHSATGQLRHTLRGHEDNAYVIEAHPNEPRIFLTAGHDGQLFIWDVFSGRVLRSFKNTIEGEGYGALFDVKWSPDGFTIAATDSHGHVAVFGIGQTERFKKIPKELFFHTDYRPLLRDLNHHVLDEQTQMAPHLMPPPFLVNIDGDPYPPIYQRLVPGREKCRDEQLVPNVILNADGEQEVLDLGLAELNIHIPAPIPMPSNDLVSPRPSIDEMIQRLAHEQDQRFAHGGGTSDQAGTSDGRERRESMSSTWGEGRLSQGGVHPLDHSYAVGAAGGAGPVGSALSDPLSPRAGRVGTRRVGDVEGVRQSTGNWQRETGIQWSRRTIVKPLSTGTALLAAATRRALGEMEMNRFVEESNRKPQLLETAVVQPSILSGKGAKPHSHRKQKKQTPAYSTRQAREARRREREEAFAEEEDFPPEESSTTSSGSSSEVDLENGDGGESSSSSSEADSTDYSDWTADAGVNLEPPKRTVHRQKLSPEKRKRKVKVKISSDEEELKLESPGKDSKLRKNSSKNRNFTEVDSFEEIPADLRPPEWLTETMPKKAPYFPQMGDELIYFMQGHMLYVEAVANRQLYKGDSRSLPWMRTINKLRDQEYVKIIGIKYEIRPPRLCCLKLGIMDTARNRLTSDSFSIRYHDMPDVLDFLILKQTYDVAVSRHWKHNDRFRCIIDDAWWLGTVETQEPHLPEFPDSMFMSYRVLWDNGERERLSPWDMEPISETEDPETRGSSVAVRCEEMEDLLYSPTEEEWGDRDCDLECDRISHGLSKVMDLAAAEPFLAPVDLNAYPTYAMIIEYPIDLTTIKSRLDNRFYRRLNAVQFDVRYVATNAEKFNKKGAPIVRQARVVTELCLRLIKDSSCTDPTPYYQTVQAHYRSPDHTDEEAEEDIDPSQGHSSRSVCRQQKIQAKSDDRPWQVRCKDLLKSLFEREDSIPFRFAVDLDRYPDYNQVIDVPMDLTTVREELAAAGYSTAGDFAKDVRIIFTNSKNYNTNKRSRIYAMTLRLEAYFEEQMRQIMNSCRGQGKRRRAAGKAPPVGGKRKLQPRGGGGQLMASGMGTKSSNVAGIKSSSELTSTYVKPTPVLLSPNKGKHKVDGLTSSVSRKSTTSQLLPGSSRTKVSTALALHSRKNVSPLPMRPPMQAVKFTSSGRLVAPPQNYLMMSDEATRRSTRLLSQFAPDDELEEGADSGEEYDPSRSDLLGSPWKPKRLPPSKPKGDSPPRLERRTSARTVKKRVQMNPSSDESDDDEDLLPPAPTATKGRVNGQPKRKRVSSSAESSGVGEGEQSTKSVKMVNGTRKRPVAKVVESSSSGSDSSSSESASENEGEPVKPTRERKRTEAKRPIESKKATVLTGLRTRSGRKVQDSDNSFEAEYDLEESSEDDEVTPPKRGTGGKMGRHGVASNVRRARRRHEDEDEDDLDDDLVTDKDFIDDQEVSHDYDEETDSDNNSDSDAIVMKKIQPDKKRKKKLVTKKVVKKKPSKKGKQSAKPPIKSSKGKVTASPAKRQSVKKGKGAPGSSRDTQSGALTSNEAEKETQPGRYPQWAPEETSEGSDGDDSADENYGSRRRTGIGGKRTHKRILKRSPEGEEGEGRSRRAVKRVRYCEDILDDEEDKSVSSRGRVRKLNTMMRDFI